MLQRVVFLVLFCTVTVANHNSRREDVGSRVAVLETLVQQQASTIQTLEARLEAQTATVEDLSSRVAKQEQTVGFYTDYGHEPYASVNVALNQPLKFNRILTNIGDGFDQTTGIFTAPYSGLYTFHLHFMGGIHNGSTDVAIYHGDQVQAIAFAEGNTRDSADQGSCTTVTHVGKGEQVSARMHGGSPVIWGATLTSFSGMLIRSD